MKIYSRDLFHGTDLRIINYSDSERQNICQLCYDISMYCYNRFIADGLSFLQMGKKREEYYQLNQNEWKALLDCFQMFDSRVRKSEYYNYNSIFVTNNRNRAIRYAGKASIMGEQGYVTQILYSCATRLWNFEDIDDERLQDEFKQFKTLMEKDPKPVVLVFRNVLEDDLLKEDGRIINWDDFRSIYTDDKATNSFRVSASSKLCLSDADEIELLSEQDLIASKKGIF